MTHTINLRRATLSGGIPPRPLGWLYSWQVPEAFDFPASCDGHVHHVPAGTWLEHGRSLVELRRMLRRTYGPGTTFSEPWKEGK
jgi:hypothetical protein